MKLFFYTGPDKRLGRFGEVKYGNPLMLTDAEAEYVTRHRDRNYRPAKKGVEFPKDAPDHLFQAATPENMHQQEVAGMNRDQLLAYGRRLQDEGRPLFVRTQDDVATLKTKIVSALKNPGGPKPVQPAKPETKTDEQE